jgi:hypothetical protein
MLFPFCSRVRAEKKTEVKHQELNMIVTFLLVSQLLSPPAHTHVQTVHKVVGLARSRLVTNMKNDQVLLEKHKDQNTLVNKDQVHCMAPYFLMKKNTHRVI